MSRLKVKCFEIEERKDLLLELPIGNYRLVARRIDTDSLPVAIYGSLYEPSRWQPNYTFAASCIEYADGTKSGFLGSYPMELEKIN